MSSINNHNLAGNVGNDPEISSFKDGTVIASFSVATSKKWKDRNNGEVKERVTWHAVKAIGKKAEIVRDYVRKGMKVALNGEPQTRNWKDENGVKHYRTEVVLNEIVFLSKPDDTKKQSDELPQFDNDVF